MKPSLTPARDSAVQLIESVRSEYPDLDNREGSEGARLRAALAISNAIALGIAELEDLDLTAEAIEQNMLSALAGGVATLVGTLSQNDKDLATHNLPYSMNELQLRALRMIEGKARASIAYSDPRGNA